MGERQFITVGTV